MSRLIVGVTIAIPAGFASDSRSYPLGVDFLGVTDDGVDFQLYYIQSNDAEPLTKTRVIEVQPAVAVINDDGRSFIGILSTGQTVWENTEAAVPDRRVRNP